MIATGPTAIRPCGFCGDPDDPFPSICPVCKGAGTITVELHPFVTLETIHEHLESLRIATGVIHHQNIEPKFGTPLYHWNACEEAVSSLFQQLVVMLPDEYARTEGDDGVAV